ncbi:S41 family peptidase [uncultured Pontibacter sp.]|uniref:S41 family peptidase n=1 Tax=uncultured Pontibacter sp. TaxID=453356 RepID=UPI0026281713|nr:S41 family peptidase [uncultured Pontibacter sp.]
MKSFKICLFFILALAVHRQAFAQDKRTVDRIATLTKVWGLMKYYHPEVASGTINWDSVYISYVPKVTVSKSQGEFNKLLDGLYNLVPAPELAAAYNLPKADSIEAIFSAKEIEAYNISGTLKQQLKKMYEHHKPVDSKYITNKYKEYTLDYVLFTEEPMATPAYPGKETRLLALARYWNTINFFYPHKQTIGKSWISVLDAYIPVFSEAANEVAYHLAIQKLNKELVDSHAFLNSPVLNNMWGPKAPFYLSYVENRFVVSKVVSDSVAKALDVKAGDIITSINGKPVKERVKFLQPLLISSNEAATNRDIADYLLHVDTTDNVTVEFKRGNQRLTKTIKRYPYQQFAKMHDKPKQPLWSKVGDGIVWVDFGAIKGTALLKELFLDLQHAKTVIMDLRKYPNYNVYLQAIPAFFQQKMPVSMSANALVTYPGFFATFAYDFERPAKSELVPFNGNMIVLVNEHTQSMGESCAFNLAQRPNTIVMGSQTAGTTGNVTWLPLPGGARVAFTGVGERGANGTFEQRKGVKIDKEVKPTIASIAAGKDALLDAAIAEAKKPWSHSAEVAK